MPVKSFKCEFCGHEELLIGNAAKNLPKDMVGFPCPKCGKRQTGDRKAEEDVDADRLLEALAIAADRLQKTADGLEAIAKRIDSMKDQGVTQQLNDVYNLLGRLKIFTIQGNEYVRAEEMRVAKTILRRHGTSETEKPTSP